MEEFYRFGYKIMMNNMNNKDGNIIIKKKKVTLQ